MKPPPLLLGAVLLFWGWQANLLWLGAIMGALVESALVFKARWDFSDEDFERIWSLCSLLLLAMVLFAFAQNDGLSIFGDFLTDRDLNSQRGAAIATARTASNLLRWLPIAFFPFLMAQTFSTRDSIPLTTISHILQRRWKLARKAGENPLPGRGFNVGFPYFCMTLLSASFHEAENNTYFWGFCGFLGWALWTLRSRRYSLAVWASIIIVAAVAGYFGQRSITYVQRYIVSLNAQWLARFLRRSDDPFQSRTQIGRVGQIKNSSAIAIRLTPHQPHDVPEYLREATYRRYENRIWFAGSSRDDFSSVNEVPLSATNQPYWPLVPERPARSSVRISCYLDGSENGVPAGLLPLPSGTKLLTNAPAFGLKMNTAGAVIAQGPGLLVFDALYGPGPTYDSPPGTNTRRANRPDSNRLGPPRPPPNFQPGSDENRRGRGWGRRYVEDEDRDVPPEEVPAIEMVLEELGLTTNTPPREAMHRLAGFFNDKFSYSTWQRGQKLSEGETPLSHFLLTSRTGHCEYFATATVLLLRQLNIPARYATGFAVHEESGDGYVVRFSDAHAWALVWDNLQQTWIDFDTTPASWIEAERRGTVVGRWFRDMWSNFKFELAKFRYGQSNLRKYILWIVIPGVGLLLYQIVFRRDRKRRRYRKQDEAFFANWPGLDSDFYQLEKQIATRGITRGEAEPLGDWLRRAVATPELADLREPLEELLQLHYRHRFDPLGLNTIDRENLRTLTSRCLEMLTAKPATAS